MTVTLVFLRQSPYPCVLRQSPCHCVTRQSPHCVITYMLFSVHSMTANDCYPCFVLFFKDTRQSPHCVVCYSQYTVWLQVTVTLVLDSPVHPVGLMLARKAGRPEIAQPCCSLRSDCNCNMRSLQTAAFCVSFNLCKRSNW